MRQEGREGGGRGGFGKAFWLLTVGAYRCSILSMVEKNTDFPFPTNSHFPFSQQEKLCRVLRKREPTE